LDPLGVGPDVEPRDPSFTLRWRKQAGQHLDRGGLPRAVGPQEAEDLALRHGERDVVHSHEVAETTRQAPDVDGEGHAAAFPDTRSMKTSSSDGSMSMTSMISRRADWRAASTAGQSWARDAIDT